MRIDELLKRYPHVRSTLERVCQRANARGGILNGTMKLGEGLDRRHDIEPLYHLFGQRALTVSSRGIWRLNFDRQFGEPGACDPWLDDLFAALEMARVDVPAHRSSVARQFAVVRGRLALAFPELTAVHTHLVAQEVYWIRQTDKLGVAGIQKALFQVAGIVRHLRSSLGPSTLANLGATYCGDSKALRSGDLFRLVGDWLLLAEGGIDCLNAENRTAALKRHNLVENPTAIKVTLFGPLVYEKAGRRFDWIKQLWQLGETATLSWDNLHDIDALAIELLSATSLRVVTCENETPFCRLVRELFAGTIIYTEGYPNAAVLRVLQLLRRSDSEFLHWGDTDFDGLRIAELLHRVQSLRLWRCDAREVVRHRSLLKPLGDRHKHRAQIFLENHSDFIFADELQFAIDHGWLEQENWSE